jgi:L-asparaginase II
MNVRQWRTDGAAGSYGPFGEAAEAEHPIVHDESASDGQVDAEPRRNPNHVVATLQHRRRQVGALGAEHVSRLRGMTKARHVDRVRQQFDADEATAARQMELRQVGIFVQGQVGHRSGRIGVLDLASVDHAADGEHEAGTERMTSAQQAAEIHGLADALDADAEVPAHDAIHAGRVARQLRSRQGVRANLAGAADAQRAHDTTMTSAPATPANPMTVEVTRGAMVESRHRVAAAVVDADGTVVRAWGDVDRPVYGRSALKPLQALPLLESGAADHYGLGPAEIALACASHNGEPRHVEVVTGWLARIGCGVDDLECGSHLPMHEASLETLILSGRKPDARYNNCSGKHAGFLTTSRHLREPTKGYIRFEHPVQQRILGVFEQLTGLRLGDAPRGIDGCGIPVIGIPLGHMGLAMARLADPDDHLPPARAAAAKRIVTAMAAEPFLVAGSGRFCTKVLEAAGAKVTLKTGAEGVYTAALPTLGLGVALKVDDGAGRAAEVAMGRILRDLKVLTADEERVLADLLAPPVHNRVGRETGRIRVADDPSV